MRLAATMAMSRRCVERSWQRVMLPPAIHGGRPAGEAGGEVAQADHVAEGALGVAPRAEHNVADQHVAGDTNKLWHEAPLAGGCGLWAARNTSLLLAIAQCNSNVCRVPRNPEPEYAHPRTQSP